MPPAAEIETANHTPIFTAGSNASLNCFWIWPTSHLSLTSFSNGAIRKHLKLSWFLFFFWGSKKYLYFIGQLKVFSLLLIFPFFYVGWCFSLCSRGRCPFPCIILLANSDVDLNGWSAPTRPYKRSLSLTRCLRTGMSSALTLLAQIGVGTAAKHCLRTQLCAGAMPGWEKNAEVHVCLVGPANYWYYNAPATISVGIC